MDNLLGFMNMSYRAIIIDLNTLEFISAVTFEYKGTWRNRPNS